MKHRKIFTYSTTVLIVFASVFLFVNNREQTVDITILHTNDVHSRIEPFPENNKRFANMGGFAKRATIINNIRKEKKNVLLFDSGDFFQGTPYFNFYDGALEIKLMSKMGYDAVTLGNHEFDNGIEHLASQLKNAKFSTVITNYDVSNTKLKNLVSSFKIFNFNGIKIGVTGIGVNPSGLIASTNVEGLIYHEPFKAAEEMAIWLKKNKKCDLVIVLSHIGARMETKVDDIHLAKSSSNIDMILGGHTHIFLESPMIIKNSIGKDVSIHQSGWGGSKIEQIDLQFTRKRK